MADTARHEEGASPLRGGIGLAALTLVISALAYYRLRNFPYPLDVTAALAGVTETLAATGPAAAKTWLVLALVVGALARAVRRRVPTFTGAEALGAAVVVAWSASYVIALTLGPSGLYDPWLLRALVALVVAAALLVRRTGPPVRPPGHGGWLAAAALALAAGPLLLLQLASPVSPFMDVLPYIASVQKIITFGLYDPFANDAAGHWAPSRQLAGINALFSLVALLTGTSAELAMTSTIVPFAALQVLGVYALGRTIRDPAAGGMAALFLLQTFVWRRTPDTRGTALAFPLIAIGLAFLCQRARHDRHVRIVLGGLALGLAVAVNPLMGALGMQVASICALVVWLDLGRSPWGIVLALAAGSVFALPQVAIGLALHVPWWTLSATALAGVVAFVLLGRLLAADTTERARPFAAGRAGVTLGLMLTVVFLHARQQTEFFPVTWLGYAPLALLAAGGLAVCARAAWHQPARWGAAALPAIGLALALANHAVADPLRFQGTVEMKSLASEVTTKMTAYWWPYWLAVASGVLFSALARLWAPIAATALALAFVIYPFQPPEKPLDFDTAQLSLAETWGFNLTNAARGYHSGRADRRWVVNDDWRQLGDLLLVEIEAGRVDYYTHVLNLSPSISSVELALSTGISTDLITPQFHPESIWNIGSRVRGLDAWPEALATRPPYILVQSYLPREHPIPDDYEELLAVPQSRIFLYRLRAADSPP